MAIIILSIIILILLVLLLLWLAILIAQFNNLQDTFRSLSCRTEYLVEKVELIAKKINIDMECDDNAKD